VRGERVGRALLGPQGHRGSCILVVADRETVTADACERLSSALRGSDLSSYRHGLTGMGSPVVPFPVAVAPSPAAGASAAPARRCGGWGGARCCWSV
jgi:hypothetical protein